MEELEKIEPYIKAKRFIASIKEETVIYKGGAILIPSYFAKGLEFDAAIVLDKKQSQTNGLVKYIMCTRALHELMEINY